MSVPVTSASSHVGKQGARRGDVEFGNLPRRAKESSRGHGRHYTSRSFGGYGTLEMPRRKRSSAGERARLVLEVTGSRSFAEDSVCRLCGVRGSMFFDAICTRQAWDPVLVRCGLMVLNVFISLAFMVATVESAWDPSIADYSEEAPTAEALKWVLLVLTLCLEGQLVEYYWSNARRKEAKLARARAVLAGEVEVRHEEDVPSASALRPVSWWILGIEMLICAITPLPYDGLGLTERAGLVMFLRIYLVIRFLHKTSPIYRLRDRIVACRPFVGPLAARSLESVRFDVLLSVKAIFDAQPSFFLLTLLVLTYFPISFAIYVQERDIQPENFDMQGSLWFTAVSMTTVGYGGTEPRDPWGQFLAMIACCIGVALLSLTVIVLTRNLQFNDAEAVAWEVAQRMRLGDDEAEAASSADRALGERKGDEDGGSTSTASTSMSTTTLAPTTEQSRRRQKRRVNIVAGSVLDLPTRLLLLRLSHAVETLSKNQQLLMRQLGGDRPSFVATPEEAEKLAEQLASSSLSSTEDDHDHYDHGREGDGDDFGVHRGEDEEEEGEEEEEEDDHVVDRDLDSSTIPSAMFGVGMTSYQSVQNDHS